MGEEKREQKGGGGMGSCYPVRSAVNVRANMFWFFFFWLMNTPYSYTFDIKSGVRESGVSDAD